jgi:hypothetical protein
MAISKLYPTYALLNRWQYTLDVNIWHFNQVAGNGAPFVGDNCTEVWIQPEREHVARALYSAVNKMKDAMGFYPRPVYLSERIPFGRGNPYSLQYLQTKWGNRKLIEFGQRATSVISAGAAIVYTDSDLDGVPDLATITVTSGVSTAEVALFFRTADGAPSAAHELWEITPITVTQSGGTTTITAPRAYFVKPSIWNVPRDPADPNTLEKNDADTTQTSDFVTAVDVYRVYTDTTTPLQVYGDPIYTQATDLDQNLATTGVARIVDAELGLFEARVENCDCVSHHIQGVQVYYKAGEALEYTHMRSDFEEACIRLANTLMPVQSSTLCDVTWQMWTEDRQSMKVDNMVLLQERDTGNPFGLKQGQVAAWHVARDNKLVSGGKITRGVR